MKLFMMLADYAAVADGKVTIVGGGWSLTGPQPTPFAIAGKIEVPWHQTNVKHQLKLELLDADGTSVPVEGGVPLVVNVEFEAGRPPNIKPGTSIDFPFALFFPPQPVPPGGQYVWQASIDGETRDEWSLVFTMRPDAASGAQAV